MRAIRFWDRVGYWVDSSDVTAARWVRAARQALLGEMPILAGGTALFAMFAVVPTLAAVVSLYAVIADPAKIQRHIGELAGLLPPDVVAFFAKQLAEQAAHSSGQVGFALALSVGIALFASRGAARALIDSLNRAYRVRERRTPAQRLLVTLAMAVTTVVAILLMVATIVALPAVWVLLGIEATPFQQWLRWPALIGILIVILTALYRYAPSPRDLGTVRYNFPGAAIASFLLVAESVALSAWLARLPSSKLYGTFGSVVAVMLWFYFSVLSLVVGGFVNAELERKRGAPDPDRSMY